MELRKGARPRATGCASLVSAELCTKCPSHGDNMDITSAISLTSTGCQHPETESPSVLNNPKGGSP